MDMIKRPRRLRSGEALRKMVRETRVSPSALIYPAFVVEGEGRREEIPSMPGQYHYSVDKLLYKAEEMLSAGVDKMMLFGVPGHKDACGSEAWAEDGVVQRAMRALKERFPELYLVGDVCMCEYTSHGHCGILAGHEVDNDKTLDYLCRIALSQVEAGADMVAPSDMMDGRVGAIRSALDRAGRNNTPIMSYAAKYASAFYGPFRDAAGSAPAFGDRKSYQMKEYAEMRLADYAKPTISYVLNAMDLSVLTGYEHEAWELGDYVRVEDKELGLSVTTRIVRREYNLQEPWNTVLELSTTLKNLGSSASEWDNAADSLEGTSMVSNNDIREMVPFNLLRNSRADDGLAYWVSSGFEADSENGASGTASFKAEGVAGMTKSLSQTVYPANRSSYTLSAQIGSEDLEKLSETSQVGIEVVIEYEDGSTESRFIDLY